MRLLWILVVVACTGPIRAPAPSLARPTADTRDGQVLGQVDILDAAPSVGGNLRRAQCDTWGQVGE